MIHRQSQQLATALLPHFERSRHVEPSACVAWAHLVRVRPHQALTTLARLPPSSLRQPSIRTSAWAILSLLVAHSEETDPCPLFRPRTKSKPCAHGRAN